jgi:hypothetical protein
MKKLFVINEEKVTKCSYSDVIEYRELFNRNPKVKWIYREAIDKAVKSVFHENWVDHPKGGETVSGVFDLEGSGRSVLNKLNTNYSGFYILVRDINRVLSAKQLELLNFNKSSEEQIFEVRKMAVAINTFKDRIFNTDSSTFNTIMSTLNRTHKLGEKRENVVVDVLKKVYGENMVSKVGGLNSSEDMTSGVDAIINTSTGTKTAQVKPFYKTTKNDTTIVFSDTGNVKEYKTDYIIFDGAKEVYVMNNDKTKIVNGQYTFPIESVLHILSK